MDSELSFKTSLVNSPLVSILIPVYNVEAYVSQCLDSIIGQTYHNLQIVVIDDGSTDESLSICQEYAIRDNRIEIYCQDNQGVAATRNHLLGKIKGDYVLFVDSDDWIEVDLIESSLNVALQHNSDIVNFQNVLNDTFCQKNTPELEIWTKEEAVFQFLRHISFNGSLWNKLIRTSLLYNLSFDNRISYGEDALFCWYVLQRIQKVVRTPNQYYHHRIHDNSISHQNWTPEKKGSGSIVWRTIVEETSDWWPQYLDVAKARYAIEDMWGLYYASLSNYPYDKHIRERQLNIRNNLSLIRKSGLVSTNKIVTCSVLAYCYPLGRLLKFTRK